MTHEFAHINGYPLRYRIGGEGPLVVFGHGLMGSIEQVDPFEGSLDYVLERVRLLIYDARGHGQSSGPEYAAGYTWETLGRDMAAFIDHAGEERAIIGGASMGAATALWVAIEQPQRAKALALLMPPPLGYGPMRAQEEKQALQVLDLLSAAVKNFGIEKTVELAKGFPGSAATPEDAEQRATWLLRQNPLTLLYAVRGLMTAPFHDPEAYRQINVPTIVVAHEGDALHPVRAAQLLKDNIPDCELLVAPQPGYWQTHPAEFLAEMTRFIDRVG
jgi:pimeloyl-ACP methyl ester carboxylesterase